MAEEVLQGVIASICTRTITVNAPGVTRFLHDKDCKSILKEMETKFQVYINPKHVPWEPLPQQVMVEQCKFSFFYLYPVYLELDMQFHPFTHPPSWPFILVVIHLDELSNLKPYPA